MELAGELAGLTDLSEMPELAHHLFSQIIPELGPLFLGSGIWVKNEDAADIFKRRFQSLEPFISSAERNGQEIDPDHLANLNWTENVFLKIIEGSPESPAPVLH